MQDKKHQHEVGWKCPKCKLIRGEDGHDPCLGKLPGVKYACCGHGGKANNIAGYVYFETGIIIQWNADDVSIHRVSEHERQEETKAEAESRD